MGIEDVDRDAKLNGSFIPINAVSGTPVRNMEYPIALYNRDIRRNAENGKWPAYFAYHLPAGTYALGWMSNWESGDDHRFFMITQFPGSLRSEDKVGQIDHHMSMTGKAQPNTPTFTVQAGQVSYVGDLLFDVTDPSKLRWSFGLSEKSAKESLLKSGLQDRMVTKPMTRFDNAPATGKDGVDAVPPPKELPKQESITSTNHADNLQLGDGNAVVIIGFRFPALVQDEAFVRSVHGGFIAIDPNTGKRINRKIIEIWVSCASLSSANECDKYQYKVYVIPPGTYALSWLLRTSPGFLNRSDNRGVWQFDRNSDLVFNMSTYGAGVYVSNSKVSDSTVVNLGSPTFSVNANEAVYVGNINADVWKHELILTHNEEDARKALFTAPYAPDMVYRQMMPFIPPGAPKQ